MRLRVRCPAKLNLFLSVGAPGERGYHPIRTIFQAVDLCDELEVEFGPDAPAMVEVRGAELPADNTLTKTLRLAQEIFSRLPSRVVLDKRIPMEAGLGGGSSNAAGLLRALNHVAPAAPAELHGVAAAVGMDVPFFLVGGRARGEGFGEQVTPLPDPAREWYLIAKPEVGCSSAAMYAALDAAPRHWRDWPEDSAFYNDFERVAPCECLDLIEVLRMAGAQDAGLSGSGSAVFGRFADAGGAERARKHLPPTVASWVAGGLSRAESLRIETIADSER